MLPTSGNTKMNFILGPVQPGYPGRQCSRAEIQVRPLCGWYLPAGPCGVVTDGTITKSHQYYLRQSLRCQPYALSILSFEKNSCSSISLTSPAARPFNCRSSIPTRISLLHLCPVAAKSGDIYLLNETAKRTIGNTKTANEMIFHKNLLNLVSSLNAFTLSFIFTITFSFVQYLYKKNIIDR